MSSNEEEPTLVGSGIALGAVAISDRCFAGTVSPAMIYKIARPGKGWPVFRINGKLAARPEAIREEIERREARAAKTDSD
jgi:hypothetical protein